MMGFANDAEPQNKRFAMTGANLSQSNLLCGAVTETHIWRHVLDERDYPCSADLRHFFNLIRTQQAL